MDISRKSLSVGITWLLQYFPKNRAILVQNCVEKKSCQNPFLAILKQKNKKINRPRVQGLFFTCINIYVFETTKSLKWMILKKKEKEKMSIF